MSTPTLPRPFTPALRINHSLTATLERRLLESLAHHTPLRITSDHLTALGLTAQIAAGAFYALAHTHPRALLAVDACILLNWLGDSLDGTLARVRHRQRPRFGFYVDHVTDLLGAIALLAGLAVSGLAHPLTCAAMLIGFLLLSAESFLATHTLARFELSQFLLGPTELRLLLIAANLAILRSPYTNILHHRILLFDLGGAIGSLCMLALTVALAARHTAQLYREEPPPMNATMTPLTRFLRFNLVGALGIVAQLTALALLNRALPHHYLLTSTLAVELAILHNFTWHQHYTWPQTSITPNSTPRSSLRALLRFHLANGLISLAGNLALMHLFVHTLHLRVLLANALAIAICGLANFLLAHHWVFAQAAKLATSTNAAPRAISANTKPVPQLNPRARCPAASNLTGDLHAIRE